MKWNTEFIQSPAHPKKTTYEGQGLKNRCTVAANSFSRCNFSDRESSYCLLWMIFSSLLMIMMFYLSIMEMERKGIGQNRAPYRLSFLFPLTISFLMYRQQLWICCSNFIFVNISFYPPSFSHCLLHPLYIRTLLWSFIKRRLIIPYIIYLFSVFFHVFFHWAFHIFFLISPPFFLYSTSFLTIQYLAN